MEVLPKRKFQCLDCGNEFEEPFGKPRWMLKCPKCQSENIVRVNVPTNREWEGGRGRRKGRRGWDRGRQNCRRWEFGFGFGRRFEFGWGRRG